MPIVELIERAAGRPHQTQLTDVMLGFVYGAAFVGTVVLFAVWIVR